MQVAVIGTAGRDKHKPYSLDLWLGMLEDAYKRFPHDKEYTLVSGGAAWADHLAVQLFLTLPNVTGLKLYLPSAFSKETRRFIGPQGSCASAANYYHEKFRGITGIESMREISHVHRMEGVHIACEPVAPGLGGFFARNKKVALAADAVLAYTWGIGKEPADGGTKNTWDQVVGRKVHVSLDNLLKEVQNG